MDKALEHLIYGQPVVSDKVLDASDILAISPGLGAFDVGALLEATPLQPFPFDDAQQSQAIALISLQPQALVGAEDVTYWLVRTHYQQAGQTAPIYQFVRLSASLLYSLGADLQPLLQHFAQPLPQHKLTNMPIEPLDVPVLPTWTLDKRVATFKTALDDVFTGDMTLLLGTLAMALGKQGLIIRNFPLDSTARYALVRGLGLLLPAIARAHLTFSLSSRHNQSQRPRLAFVDDEQAFPDAPCLDWANPAMPNTFDEQPYIAHLHNLWTDDVISLMQHINTLETLAGNLMRGQALNAGLTTLVQRHQKDLAVTSKADKITTQDMIAVLDGDVPPHGQLRFHYLEQLLRRALDERDADAAKRITQEIDEDPHLAEPLRDLFVEALETQPDALYVLARNRLSEGMEDHWLRLLHDAGRKSLQVAIENGDPQTLSSWLTLVAREPQRYRMGDILREGLMAARNRAEDSAELAQQLLTLAVKRQPDLLPTLIQDQALVAQLPQQQIASLRDFDPQAIEALAENKREIFLLALQQALEAQQTCISAASVRELWEIHTQSQTGTLAPQYRPLTLIQRMATTPGSLLDGALETLLSLTLTAEDDALFYEIAGLLAVSDSLSGVLVNALEQSGRSVQDMLTLISTLMSNETLQPQAGVDAYAQLLTNRNWNGDSQPLVEQLARVMSQYPDTQAATVVLWNVLELSGDLKNEQMLRVASRRLRTEIGAIVSEVQLLENLDRLRKGVQWHPKGHSAVMRWWREYARGCSMAQLQKIEKAIDGKRTLEDVHSVVRTTIALRRAIGQRSLTEFAEAVNTAYGILGALADGFDPDGKVSVHVDSATIRGMIEQRADEITPDARHVLATNLKELAQIVTSMADNRSRPAILRSDDTVERQLVTGEQQPQSAIDVMRWLSGYLDGMQRDEETD